MKAQEAWVKRAKKLSDREWLIAWLRVDGYSEAQIQEIMKVYDKLPV